MVFDFVSGMGPVPMRHSDGIEISRRERAGRREGQGRKENMASCLRRNDKGNIEWRSAVILSEM